MSTATTACTVYRCARQTEMYLYLRSDLKPEELPEGLRKITGAITEVMKLDLAGDRKLARVDKTKVIEALAAPGYFLQMPPDGHIKAHLHFGD